MCPFNRVSVDEYLVGKSNAEIEIEGVGHSDSLAGDSGNGGWIGWMYCGISHRSCIELIWTELDFV